MVGKNFKFPTESFTQIKRAWYNKETRVKNLDGLEHQKRIFVEIDEKCFGPLRLVGVRRIGPLSFCRSEKL